MAGGRGDNTGVAVDAWCKFCSCCRRKYLRRLAKVCVSYAKAIHKAWTKRRGKKGGNAQAVRLLHELRVGAALNKTTALQHTDAVTADDCAEAVGYDDGCGTLLG